MSEKGRSRRKPPRRGIELTTDNGRQIERQSGNITTLNRDYGWWVPKPKEPTMSHTEIRFKPLITRLQEHFREHQYGFGVTWNYPVAARRFLRDLERRGLKIETVNAADVERYLDALRMK